MLLRMMRPCAALWLVVAAGCGGNGIDLVVPPTPGVDRVEVFLAPERCADGDQVPACDPVGIAWDDLGPKQPGDIFILDVDEVTEAKIEADGTRRVRLQAHGGHEHLQRLVILGFRDDALGETVVAGVRLEDVDLPSDAPATWQIALQPIEDITPNTAAPAGDAVRAHGWGRTGAAKCIVTEVWDAGDVTREFLVPPGDTDCDAVVQECDPFAYHATVPPPNGQASCKTDQFRLPGVADYTCLAGGTVCTDDQPATGCSPLQPYTCAPDALCQVASCAGALDSCVSARAIGAIYCAIPSLDVASPPCGPPSDVRAHAIVDLGAVVGATGHACGVPSFGPLVLPASFAPAPFTAGGGVFDATPAVGVPCAFTLTWSGGTNLANGFMWMDIPIDNGLHSILPIELEFTKNGCTASVAMSCTTSVQSIDGVANCALPP